jgi:hypothetical protein
MHMHIRIRIHIHIHMYIHTYTQVRKLLMASVLIFVYEGTSSQIATGFLITLASLLLALWLRPFNDDGLQGMHQWSLFVQATTLFSGLMIKAGQFKEIIGEKGGRGADALGGIILFLHAFVTVSPLLEKVSQKLRLWMLLRSRGSDNSISSTGADSCEDPKGAKYSQQGPGVRPARFKPDRTDNMMQLQSDQDVPPFETSASPVFIYRTDNFMQQQSGQNAGLINTMGGVGPGNLTLHTPLKQGAGAQAHHASFVFVKDLQLTANC